MTTEPQTTLNVDFEPFHSALKRMSLARPKGVITHVAGLTVESSGLKIGLHQLCRIRLHDNRQVEAEVIGFRKGGLVLLPLESIDGIRPGDTVTPLDKPRLVPLHPSISRARAGRAGTTD
jgi:flagellum-specific ATP synthase